MTLSETETCLEGLSEGEDPLVRIIPARSGQKEKRYVQLLSGEPDLELSASTARPDSGAVPQKSRLETLEAEVNTLKSEFHALREDLAAFKKFSDEPGGNVSAGCEASRFAA